MENGGIHKHTWFYLVEIGLAAVLVLVTVLFFLWNGSLNDHIASLTQERDDSQEEATLNVEDDTVEVSEGYDGDVFSSHINGKYITLYPYKYKFGINGVVFVDIEVPASGPTTNISLRKTNQENIVGLRWESYGLFTERRDYFIDTKSSKVVSFNGGGNWFSPVHSPTVTVGFGDTVFNLAADLRDVVDECINATLPLCGTGTMHGLLVNGDQVIVLDPVEVQFFEHAEGGVWTPSVNIVLLGVSPDISMAYFSFLSETYSINNVGGVEQTNLPDDLVTMTDESYE